MISKGRSCYPRGPPLLQQIPDELRQLPQANLLAGEADEKVYNIINLIYHSHNYEGTSKDYEFSRRTMEEHWSRATTTRCAHCVTRSLAKAEITTASSPSTSRATAVNRAK